MAAIEAIEAGLEDPGQLVLWNRFPNTVYPCGHRPSSTGGDRSLEESGSILLPASMGFEAVCSHLKAILRSCPHALVRMSKVVSGGRRMPIYADFWLLLMRSVSSGQSLNLDFELACTLIPTVDIWDSDFEAGGPVLGLSIGDIPSPDGFVDGLVPGVGIRNATTLDSDADQAMDGANTFNALTTCPFSPDMTVRILVYGRYDFPNLASVVGGSPHLTVDVEVRTTLGFVRDVIRGRLELQPSENLRLFCYGILLSYHGSEILECWQLLSPTGLEAWPLALVVFYDFGEEEDGNPDS